MKNFIAVLVGILNSLFATPVDIATQTSAPEASIRPNMRPTSVKNIDHIKEFEQLRLQAYLPTPNDRWTIGWGHTRNVIPNSIITVEMAERYLRDDLAWVEDAIEVWVKVPLNQNQYDALAGLIFNIGETHFSNSTVLRKLNQEDYDGAADAFLMWNKQRSKKTGELVVLRGLDRRRNIERDMFLKG